jgi:transposase InsO family protein
MKQVARNVTMDEWGFLSRRRYLILDRDTKYCAAFRKIIESAGVKIIRLPPMSPDLNAYAERFVRSAKEEALSRLVLFGEAGLRRAIDQFIEHHHEERNHQGVGNVLPFPSGERQDAGPIRCSVEARRLITPRHRQNSVGFGAGSA